MMFRPLEEIFAFDDLTSSLEKYRIEKQAILASCAPHAPVTDIATALEQVSEKHLRKILPLYAENPAAYYRAQKYREDDFDRDQDSIGSTIHVYSKKMRDAAVGNWDLTRALEYNLRKSVILSLRLIAEESGLDPARDFKHRSFFGVQQTGGHLFLPGRFMGWHTNANNPGYRIYFNHTAEGGKSFFRYLDPATDEVVTVPDQPGWQARVFCVSSDAPLWHCVYSDTVRFSVGFNLNFPAVDLEDLPNLQSIKNQSGGFSYEFGYDVPRTLSSGS